MAKIKPKKLVFPESAGANSYVVYIEPTATPTKLDYGSQAANVTDFTELPNGEVEIQLEGLDIMQTVEGKYDIGVTAMDLVGNESAMSVLYGVTLDFVAPDAPGPLRIV